MIISDTTSVEKYTIPSFQFTSFPNSPPQPIHVAYRCLPASSTPSKGTVLLPTCYGGRIDNTQVFPCLSSYDVVIVAMLGSGESSSPSNDPNFPRPNGGTKTLTSTAYSAPLRYEDCVRAQYALLTEHLKVRELEAVIGFSMGGQQAYYWSIMYPTFSKRIVSICSAARTSPHNVAFLEGPKSALLNSIDYNADGVPGGYKAKGIKPVRGLRAFGRAYNAWLTSAAWFRQRLWEEVDPNCKSVEQWIEQDAEDFVAFDADDLLVTAEMWQAGDVGVIRKEDGGDYRKALRDGVRAKVLVMPCRTDQYFPPEDSEEEVKALGDKGELAVIESIWGHPAGGGMNKADSRWSNERIERFLRK